MYGTSYFENILKGHSEISVFGVTSSLKAFVRKGSDKTHVLTSRALWIMSLQSIREYCSPEYIKFHLILFVIVWNRYFGKHYISYLVCCEL